MIAPSDTTEPVPGLTVIVPAPAPIVLPDPVIVPSPLLMVMLPPLDVDKPSPRVIAPFVEKFRSPLVEVIDGSKIFPLVAVPTEGRPP